MATSEQNPSPALLRLRPSDVVRLCGLNAAAAGLEQAANHSVIASHREGSRLEATVKGNPPRTIWVAIPHEMDSARWACGCAQTGPLACEHVAAILSAWIAHPADFIARDEAATTSDDPPATLPTASGDVGQGLPQQPHNWPAPNVPTTLVAALARMNATDVGAIARRILGGTTEAADDARGGIVAALSNSAHLRSLLNRLDDSARMLLTLLDIAGGTITSADLEELSARITQPLSAVQGDVAVLERHALLLPMLPTGAPGEYRRGSSWRHIAGWRIPDEVRQALPTSLPLAALPTQAGGRSAPMVESQAAPLHMLRGNPRALCLALALLAEAPPPLGLTQVMASPGDTSLPARHGSGLLAPGELAPERLKDLARGAGIDVEAARLARRILRQAREQQPIPAVAGLARLPLVERPVVLRAAFRRWLRTNSAADLLDIDAPDGGLRVRYATAHPGFRPTSIARDVSDGRRFVAHLLRRAQPDTWYSLESVVALVWQVRPGLLRSQQQAWASPVWWLESTREQRVLQAQSREDWMAGDGAFIRSLLGGTLYTWGIVDLATREDGTAVAFRLAPFGEFLLRREHGTNSTREMVDSSLVALCDADWGPPVLPLREGTLAVQPLSAGAALLDALALWATPTAVSGKRLVYTLSPDRACVAFDQQLAPDTLPDLLRPFHARAADHVASQLNQWYAAWGQTRITTGFTLLEASDEATLIEVLAAAPEIAPRCQRIGPALALAQPKDAAVLRSLLAQRGYAV